MHVPMETKCDDYISCPEVCRSKYHHTLLLLTKLSAEIYSVFMILKIFFCCFFLGMLHIYVIVFFPVLINIRLPFNSSSFEPERAKEGSLEG